MDATHAQDQKEVQGTELQRQEGGMQAGPRQQAEGIITFLRMEGRNREVEETEVEPMETGMEEEQNRLVEVTGIGPRVQEVNTVLEEGTGILEFRTGHKWQDRTEVKM